MQEYLDSERLANITYDLLAKHFGKDATELTVFDSDLGSGDGSYTVEAEFGEQTFLVTVTENKE